MYYLLFTFYLAIAVYLIPRIPFIKKSGLSPAVIVSLLLIKIFAGLAVGWMSQKFYPGNDYWAINKDGLEEYKIMMSDPVEFLTNIFKSPYENGYTGFFNSIGSYWNDLRYNIILKMIAFCDIFSRGNYYINSLFFNFFGFFGPVALFRVFDDIYKNRKWAIIIGCFLLPSLLYYSSGIHKDLVIFTMLGFFCYALYFSSIQKSSIKRLLVILVSFMVILLVRNFVAIALIPASIAFIVCSKRRNRPFLVFASVYACLILAMFLLQVLIPSFQPLKIITQKQNDFLNLPTAATQLTANVLEPNLMSFVQNLPQAVDHGFLRPHLWDTKGNFILAFALELLFYELLFIVVLFKSRFRQPSFHSFILFAIFFGISMLLITGFIIPNTGSIVRYKSIYLPFLVTPLLCAFTRKN
ncbi:MAG: hypothetical protein ABIN36_04925 [Ferruginibacter sp.]